MSERMLSPLLEFIQYGESFFFIHVILSDTSMKPVLLHVDVVHS